MTQGLIYRTHAHLIRDRPFDDHRKTDFATGLLKKPITSCTINSCVTKGRTCLSLDLSQPRMGKQTIQLNPKVAVAIATPSSAAYDTTRAQGAFNVAHLISFLNCRNCKQTITNCMRPKNRARTVLCIAAGRWFTARRQSRRVKHLNQSRKTTSWLLCTLTRVTFRL